MSKLIDAINAERWENEILDDARSQDQWSADRTDHNESIDKLSRIAEKIEAENAALRAQVPKVVKPKETDKILFGLPYSYFACKCGCVVVTSYCYCPECCARLDWSEVAL